MGDMSKLVSRYTELRLLKAKLKKTLDTKLVPVNEEMSEIESEMLKFLSDSGQTSAKTENGSFYKRSESRISVTDAASLTDFILKNEAVDLLQMRVVKSIYDDYIENGLNVPGVKVDSMAKIVVRKS